MIVYWDVVLKRGYHSGHPKPQALMNCTGGSLWLSVRWERITLFYLFFLRQKVETKIYRMNILQSDNNWKAGCRCVCVCVMQAGSVSLSVCTLTVLCGLGRNRVAGVQKGSIVCPKPSCVHVVVPLSPGLSATYRSGPNRSLPAYFFLQIGLGYYMVQHWSLHICGFEVIESYLVPKSFKTWDLKWRMWHFVLRMFEWFLF